MVGTSAIRSSAARHRVTARRNANTVRTTRMAMGTDFVCWARSAARKLPKPRRGGHVALQRVALRSARGGAGIAPDGGYGHLMGGGIAAR
jgi:hypothetical protein